MATLYKRANPMQKRMLRIIEGAVKNALDAHPDYGSISREKFARSIAKRAVGTLSSQLGEVLALGSASVTDDREADRRSLSG